jgi:1-acyl-sn-glycerol-3-phosphate acyltransferase
MNYLLKPLQWIYSIYALLLFIVIMFIALPFVVAGSFFGKVKGGNFIYNVCKTWGYVWYPLIGMWHKNIYEVPHDHSGQYIFVANHSSYMDIPPVVMCLKQAVRILGKYEIVKYPVFGFIYKNAVVTVNRKNAEERAKSVRVLKNALSKHISILIFPEGTFNETGNPLKNFYDGAFRLAIETQTPVKPLLFIDALDRLHYRGLLQLAPGPNRVVFMEEVPVEGLTMKDVPMLKQKVYNVMDAGLRRYRKYKTAPQDVTETVI